MSDILILSLILLNVDIIPPILSVIIIVGEIVLKADSNLLTLSDILTLSDKLLNNVIFLLILSDVDIL